VRIKKIFISESDWLTIPYTVTDTAVVFGPLSLSEQNLLRLTPSQTDTICQVSRWEPRQTDEGRTRILMARSVFYNGKLVAELDFEKDPKLQFRLSFTNDSQLSDSTFVMKFTR